MCCKYDWCSECWSLELVDKVKVYIYLYQINLSAFQYHLQIQIPGRFPRHSFLKTNQVVRNWLTVIPSQIITSYGWLLADETYSQWNTWSGNAANFKGAGNRTAIDVEGDWKVHKSFVLGLLIFKKHESAHDPKFNITDLLYVLRVRTGVFERWLANVRVRTLPYGLGVRTRTNSSPARVVYSIKKCLKKFLKIK